MKRLLILCCLASACAVCLTSVGVTAWSAELEAAQSEQTRNFKISKMTCALCPVTVRKAMERVDGVKAVSVDYETKTATVTFDPAVAEVGEIADASTNVGFPAEPVDG